MFDMVMDNLTSSFGLPSKIVHGDFTAADVMAKKYAKKMGIYCYDHKADWKSYGSIAGTIRNEHMLIEHEPKIVIAFPGGIDTADMVKKAKLRKSIKVIEILAS
jgi:hypothetical protein